MIKEWDFLRVVACLSIVLLHTTTWLHFLGPRIEDELLLYARVLLCFATPAFIMLSIMILANKYPRKLPDKFWLSRLQFLLLPFLFWAVIDAAVRAYGSGRPFAEYAINNILYGGFVGWFVLVILQLYVMYMLVLKGRVAQFIVLPVGAVLSFIVLNEWLLPTHFYEANEKLLRISFAMWLIYFAVAYVSGRYYTQLIRVLVRLRYVLVGVVVLTSALVYGNFSIGLTEAESRRLDLVPFVIAVTFMLLAFGQCLPTSRFVQFVSRYAFAIYLIHWQVLYFVAPFFHGITNHFWLQTIGLFSTTIALSIAIAHLISKLPFGHYLVGKIKPRRKIASNIVDITSIRNDELERKSS